MKQKWAVAVAFLSGFILVCWDVPLFVYRALMETTAPFSDVILDRGKRRPAVLQNRLSWFSEKGDFSCYLALSALKFPGCLDGVLLRLTRGHVFANVDGTQQHADPLLTR